MKAIMLLAGVAMSASSLLAGETLQVKLVPDRGVRVRNRPQEVVVKIDLSAIAEKRESHRTPLNPDGGQYGYTNIFELGPLLDVKTTAIPFDGTETH